MCIGARQIVAIVRGNKRDARLAGELDEVAVDARFNFQALILDLQEETAFPENVAEAARVGAGLLVLFEEKSVRNLAAKAGGERDQTSAMLREKIVVHPGLVVEAFEETRRDELDEVSVAFFILTQENEVIRTLCLGAAVLVTVGRDIHLAADNRLDAVRRGLMEKIRSSEQIAMVRDSHGRHPLARGFRRELADFTRPVEK